MLLAFLAAAGAQAADVRPAVRASTPARASVRILRAVEIRRDRFEAAEGSMKRTAVIHERDGTARSASLIEFY